MLRQRPHRDARGVLSNPVTSWLALSALYFVAFVLNVLLALGSGRFWLLCLAMLLGAASAGCAVAAARGRRQRGRSRHSR
jgi:hypothetical protein